MNARPQTLSKADQVMYLRAKSNTIHSDLGTTLPDKPVLVLLLFVIFLRMSHMHVLFGGLSFQITLAIELAIYLYYAALSAKSFNYGAITIILLYTTFLIVEVLNFSFQSGFPFKINAIFQFISILSVFVFYETKATSDFIQRVIISIAAVYLIIYNLFYDQILAAAPIDSSLYRPADGIREARLNLAHGLATFGLLVGFFSFKQSPFKSLVLIILGLIAVFGAESRAFSAALGIGMLSMAVGSFFPTLRSTINLILASVFLLLCLYFLGPQFGLDYNPYGLFLGDGSGWARYMQFRDGLYVLGNSFFLGVGIPTSTEDLQYFVNPVRPFFASDLGIFGISFLFGLPFTVLYVLLSVRLITRPALNEHQRRLLPLFYTVQLQAFLGFFSAGILNSTTVVFVALTIALWLKNTSTQREVKRAIGATSRDRHSDDMNLENA